jgi:hypothetical protein
MRRPFTSLRERRRDSATGKPAPPTGAAGVDLGFTAKAPTVNLAAPVRRLKFPAR